VFRIKATTLSEQIILKYALSCDITQRPVVIPYRSFGTNYWSHLERKKSKKKVLLLDFLTLGDETDSLSRKVDKELLFDAA